MAVCGPNYRITNGHLFNPAEKEISRFAGGGGTMRQFTLRLNSGKSKIRSNVRILHHR